MKVLLITDNHTPSGGAENYFLELKARLKKESGITVYSLGFGQKQSIGPDFFILKSLQSNFSKLLWRFFLNPIIYLRLRKQIKIINPDIIHLHNIKQYPLSLLKAIKPYPVVQTVHDFSLICPIAQNLHKDLKPCETGLRRKCFWQHQIKYNKLIYPLLAFSFLIIRKRLKNTVKKFIAPSPLLTHYLEKNGFENVSFIPPFKKEKKSFSFDKMKQQYFLFAGHLGAHKGTFLLLEEFALLYRKNKNIILKIAGSDPSELQLQKKAQTLGIEKNVIFLGWQEDLTSLFEECTAVLFPSLGLESFGLMMTEAMAHARPIIGANRGTIPWLVEDNETGLLFDPLTRGDLAKKMDMLATHTDRAQQLGENGFRKLQDLIDNGKVIRAIISIYESCITAIPRVSRN